MPRSAAAQPLPMRNKSATTQCLRLAQSPGSSTGQARRQPGYATGLRPLLASWPIRPWSCPKRLCTTPLTAIGRDWPPGAGVGRITLVPTAGPRQRGVGCLTWRLPRLRNRFTSTSSSDRRPSGVARRSSSSNRYRRPLPRVPRSARPRIPARPDASDDGVTHSPCLPACRPAAEGLTLPAELSPAFILGTKPGLR